MLVSKQIVQSKFTKLPKKKNILSKSLLFSYCKNCGKEINKNKIYCSSKCACEFKHKSYYQNYLTHPEQYSRGNYTPCRFYKEFLEEQSNKCAICGCSPIHNNKILRFVIDHIDGNAANNRRDNIRLICPNCDSQTETFKSKNKNSARRNYFREKIMKTVENFTELNKIKLN